VRFQKIGDGDDGTRCGANLVVSLEGGLSVPASPEAAVMGEPPARIESICGDRFWRCGGDWGAHLAETTTSFNLFHRKSITENPCQLFFANDGSRRAGQQSDRIHVRFLTAAVVANPLITRSEEAATNRCHEGVSRHCEGIGRWISSPQILLGWHQCAHQTLRCTPTPNNIPLPL